MKMLPGFQRNRHKKGLFAASSLLLLLATQTVAQSGRRAPPKPSPTPTPQTDAEVTPKSSARELKQRVSRDATLEDVFRHYAGSDLGEDTSQSGFRAIRNTRRTARRVS